MTNLDTSARFHPLDHHTSSNAPLSGSARTAARSLLVALAVVASACGGAGPDETQSFGQASSASGGLASMQLSSVALTAGGDLTGTITLASAASGLSGGVNVYLSFPRPVFAGPRFVRVPNGQRTASFTLSSNPYLSASTSTLLFANTQSPDPNTFLSQGVAVTAAATPPAAPRPDVAAVAFVQATVTSGTASTGTVTLTGPAPAGGAVVQVSNPNDFFNQDAGVPAVVIVPEGATQASFLVPTHLSSPVATSSALPIAASYFGGPFRGAYLTIVAP